MLRKQLMLILSFMVICFLPSQAQNNSPLIISHLTGDIYVYTTFNNFKGERFPANGLYMVTNEGIVMIDTPWDTTQIQPLMDSMQVKHHKSVVLCISTHYHDDRTGGVDFLKRKGVKTYASKQTYDLCREKNEKQPQFFFVNDTTFNVGNCSIQTCYAGEGHTKDNIVIWFPKNKVLYGGCLVKSTEVNDLGNVKEANLDQWPLTIITVMKKYSRHKYVVPGHFGWTSNKSMEHTLQLLNKDTKPKNKN